MRYGDPVEVEGKTIIPVAKVMYGLGGGFGKMKTTDREGLRHEKPAGESGGGGIRIVPMGVVEIYRDQTRFIPLGSRKINWAVALSIAFLAGFFLGRFL